MPKVRIFRGGYRVISKSGDLVVSVSVVERLFLMLESGHSLYAVAKKTQLKRSFIEAIYTDLLRQQRRMLREARPSGVLTDQVIGHAFGSGVGPNNDYLLPREGSEEAQRIDEERAALGAR